MKFCRIFLFILICLHTFIEAKEKEVIIKNTEDLMALLEQEKISYEQYLTLYQLLTNKVNLNSDEIFSLILIPGVDLIEIKKIYEYSQTHNNFSQISDIKKLSFLNEELYEKIEAFIIIVPKKSKNTLQLEAFEILDEEKYDTKSFLFKTSHYEKYAGCLSIRKQAANKEEIEHIYFETKNNGYLEKIIIGNFRAIFGEGLTLGNEFKGLNLKFKKDKISTYFIYDQREILGNNTEYLFDNGTKYGFIFYSDAKRKCTYGCHTYLPLKETMIFFSEVACVNSKSLGFIAGMNNCYQNVESLLSYRNYAEDFNNPLSNGFADADGEDDDCDEQGIYWELNYRLWQKMVFKFYFDQWKHPSTLITDNEFFTGIYLTPLKKINLNISFKRHDENIASSGRIQNTTSGESLKTFFRLNISLSPHLKFLLSGTRTQKDVEKYIEKMQEDIYGKLQFQYYFFQHLKTSIGYEYKNIDINEEGGLTTGYLGELEDQFNRFASLKVTFKITKYQDEFQMVKYKMSVNSGMIFKW